MISVPVISWPFGSSPNWQIIHTERHITCSSSDIAVCRTHPTLSRESKGPLTSTTLAMARWCWGNRVGTVRSAFVSMRDRRTTASRYGHNIFGKACLAPQIPDNIKTVCGDTMDESYELKPLQKLGVTRRDHCAMVLRSTVWTAPPECSQCRLMRSPTSQGT